MFRKDFSQCTELYFFSEVPIRRLLKMVGDYKSEGQQLMQTLLHAPIKPRQRRDAVKEDGRFVHTGNDTTINLIPVFTLVILGVAGINIITPAKDIHFIFYYSMLAFAFVLTGSLGGAGGLPFAAAKAGVETPAPGDQKRF